MYAIDAQQINGPVLVLKNGKLIHPDQVDISRHSSRRKLAEAVAMKVGEPCQDEIEKLLVERYGELVDAIHRAEAAPMKPTSESLLAQMPEHVRNDALDLLSRPELIEEIQGAIRRLGIVGDETPALGVYVVGTSRLLERPLAAIVRGASSSGKSNVITTVAKMFPPETKYEAHKLSAKALYYDDDDALMHKFVIAGERSRRVDDEQADATKALREMISDGVLRAAVTEQVDGRMRTSRYEKHGPIAYVESTSAARLFGEDENRCLTFHVDESAEQTRSVILAAARDAARDDMFHVAPLEIEVHHAIQRMLKPLRVIIPFAEALAPRFPSMRVEARRGIRHLLNTIKAVALLRQFQKVRRDGAIEADTADYAVALKIVRPTIDRLAGSFDQQCHRVWEAIQKHARDDDEFSITAAAAWCGIRREDVSGRLRILAELGHVTETQEHRGNKPAKFKINPNQPEEGLPLAVQLPAPEELDRIFDGRYARAQQRDSAFAQ